MPLDEIVSNPCITFACRLILALLVGANLGSSQTSELVSLQLSITDCWGHSVAPATITVTSAGGTVAIVHYPDARHVSVAPGSYTVIIEAPGYTASAKRLDTRQQQGVVPICLVASSIELPGPRPSSLTGNVERKLLTGQGQIAWIRLVGLYSEVNRTSVVDDKGDFSFAELQPGRYRVMFFLGGELRQSRDIDVRAYTNKIRID